MSRWLTTLLLPGALVIVSARPCYPATFNFDFDTLLSGVRSAGIQTYMQGQLLAGQNVTVTTGVVTDRNYNNDHVSSCGAGDCKSAMFGTDTFILSTADRFSFTFTLPGAVIDSVSFDYEIFPHETCPAFTNAKCTGTYGDWRHRPDFKFSTNLGEVFRVTGAGHRHSHPGNSPSFRSENAPQPLVIGGGPWIKNVAGATTLTFTDWRGAIGIDNLKVNYHTSTIPEPASMILLATVAMFVVSKFRTRAAAKRSQL